MGGDAIRKAKKRRGAEAGEYGGAPAVDLAATATPAAEVKAAAAAPASNGAAVDIDKKKKQKKRKRKPEQCQALEKESEGGGVDGLSTTSIAPANNANNHATRKDVKRCKKGERRQPRAPEVVTASASAAAAAAGTPGAGTVVSPQPPALACTSKVAEYAAADGWPKKKKKKKKKRKLKKDKRQKTGGRSSPSNHRHAPPLLKMTTPSGENSNSNDDDDDDDDNDDDDVTEDKYESSALEGIFHDGVMYLVDSRRKVFSAQRDEQGNLVEVGTFDDGCGKVVIVEKPPSDGPTNGNTSLAVAAEGVVPPRDAPENAGVSDATGNSSSSKKKTKDKGGNEAGAGVVQEDAAGTKTGNVVDYPFEVEECDHCETSERAYADIAPLLSALAAGLGKTPQELVIYDPYYCQGSTVARLASLGFPRVHNRKEDFYKVVKDGTVPEHDVVVTNPPFSGDHVPKILSFCARQGAKPWFLLLPNYVYLKDFYESSLGRGPDRSAALPFYLTPPKRYMYYSPAGSRLKVKSSERKTSPFNTFWYIRLGDGGVTSKILQSYDAVSRKAESDARCCVARTSQQIPYKMMDSNDPRRKKARDRQRSIDRVRKKKSEWVVG